MGSLVNVANEVEVVRSISTRRPWFLCFTTEKKEGTMGRALLDAYRRERCAPICADACSGRNGRRLGNAIDKVLTIFADRQVLCA